MHRAALFCETERVVLRAIVKMPHAARTARLLQHSDLVPLAQQLLGRHQARGTSANHGLIRPA